MIDPARLVPLRHRFVRSIRAWFDSQGFCEVETPYAVKTPGMEPHLRAFEVSTQEGPPSHRSLFLHTSPEYHMKRVLARLATPIFQVCRCYRDEPSSRLHHPEFTMVEWYRPNADYLHLMEDCQGLLRHLGHELLGGAALALTDGDIDLYSPIQRLTVRDAMIAGTGVDPWHHSEGCSFANALNRSGFEVPGDWPWEDLFHFALLERVEGDLGRETPTVLMDYPPSLAALSRVVGDVAERFELYIAGHELANAFSELIDPEEQRNRFLVEQQERREAGNPVYPIDDALLEALAQMPPSAGIALGVDRLWLLFAEHWLQQRLELKDVLFLQL